MRRFLIAMAMVLTLSSLATVPTPKKVTFIIPGVTINPMTGKVFTKYSVRKCGYGTSQAAMTASYNVLIPENAWNVNNSTYQSMPCSVCVAQWCYEVSYYA